MQMYGVAARRINRLIYQQTGTYGQQFRRSYELAVDESMLGKIEEAVVTSTKLSPTDLAHPTKQFISQSAGVEEAIGIVNGFNTPRLRYWLEIETTDQLGNANVTVVTGYTDHADLSMSGRIDPKTTFFINNVMRSRKIQAVTPLGNQMRTNVLASEQLIIDAAYASGGGVFNPRKTAVMTPASMFDRMRSSDLTHAAEELYGSGNQSMLIDTVTTVNNRPTYNNRSHNLGSHYAADILNTYIGTRMGSRDHGESLDYEVFFRDCKSQVTSHSCEEDNFLNFLNSRKSGFLTSASNSGPNTFKLEDLRAYDPNYEHVMKPIAEQRGLSSANNCASWGSTEAETKFAADVATAVAGLMTTLGFHKLGFRATNLAYVTREHEVSFSHALGVNGSLNAGPEISAFRHRLETEVLNQACFGHLMGYELELTCDMAGDTWIKLSLEGREEYMYVSPTFCDALMAPVTTIDLAKANSIASQLNDIGSQLVGAKLNHQRRGQSIISMGAQTAYSGTVFGGASNIRV